jgi:hypothetical protein
MFYGSRDPVIAGAAFDKDMIIQCCNNYIARREARIQRDIEKAIREEMVPDTRSRLKKMFFKLRGPAKTREEAIERLKEDPGEFLMESVWDRIHNRGINWLEKVESIRAMARNTSFPYIVLTNEGEFILNYKEVNQ